MAAAANATNSNKCMEGEYVFWLPADKGLVAGHIYSDAGRAEFKISRLCEYHFDQFTDFGDE